MPIDSSHEGSTPNQPVPHAQHPSNREFSPYKPLLAFAAVALLIALTSFYTFQRIETLIEADELSDLGAIADTKSEQIVSWRDSQKRLGETFSRNSMFAAEFGRWLQEGAPANERMQGLRKRLIEVQHVNGYKTLALLDRRGTVRLSANNGSDLGEEETRQALQAMNGREEVFYDFHRNSYGDKGISIDLIVPLTIDGRNAEQRVVGAAVLQIDPYYYLYPLIQSWPGGRSESGESLLVRQEGSDVLYLNELRYRKDAALSLRMPLTAPALPAAMAVRGEVRAVDAVDYRGVQVVSEMRRVPGAPWFVVSKMDREELFAPITRLKYWSMGLGIIFVAIGGMLGLLLLRSQKTQYQYLRVQRDAAVEREMLMKHFEYLTRYANDIIIVTDDAGNIIEANERAVEAYGYPLEELLWMKIPDLRDPGEDPSMFAGQIRRCLEEGALRYEANSRRKDGTIFPAEVSARLIKVDGARYIQGIIRDVGERKRAEQALRRSETLLNESQKMAHIGSWELDLVKNILYWTDENYRIFEMEPALFGASYEAFLNIVHPDDRAMVDKVYTDSVKNRTPYIIVHRLLFPDQRVKFVREWCETFYDEAGRPLRSIGTTQDITEQQLAQEALRKSAEEIEDLYNNAPCGYHSLDKDGVIIRINDTLLHWLGYTRDELVEKVNVADLLSENSRKVFQSRYPAFKERGFVHDIEYEFLRKDGTLLPVALSSTAIYDADGQYSACRSTMFDITNRRLAEKKLAESEERFRTMADNAPIMIWMEDVQDQRSSRGGSFFNQRWHEFTGLTQEQTQGGGWQVNIHPDDRKFYLDTYREAFEKRTPFRIEYRLRCRDGIFRWIEDSGIPRFTADGEFLGYIGVCLDVTEHKLFEKIRVEMEHMDRLNIAGEMASGLAHELSQPLTAANNYLDACLRRMAEDNWDHAALQKTVRLAHDQTERAGKIIGHLKDIVRKQKYERTMLDINSVIKDSVRFLDYELHHHFISVTLDISTLPPVLANRIEIEQVLINLIKNAIDSMRSSPRRELRIATRVIESGAILVTVSDTGEGVVAEDMEKIFNPFHSSKKDGLGLGLAICRSLIEEYGGKIWAEQKEDEGSEFNFTLACGATYD